MAKHYGNRTSPRSRSNLPHQLLIVVLTFLLGYLSASFIDIKTAGHWLNSQIISSEEEHHRHNPKQVPTASQVSPKPKFEFYTLLANEKGGSPKQNQGAAATHSSAKKTPEVLVPTTQVATSSLAGATTVVTQATPSNTTKTTNNQQATRTPIAQLASTKTPPSSKGNYLVQVAAFKAKRDAEQMKGLLTLKGFEVRVVSVANPVKGVWHRVVIGPYPNRGLAQKAQMILAKTERLNGMVTNAG